MSVVQGEAITLKDGKLSVRDRVAPPKAAAPAPAPAPAAPAGAAVSAPEGAAASAPK